jgi:putative ABC transport system permease protein
MFRNYLMTTWRNIKKNPVFSAINLIGLSLGLAVCILILEYVEHERSYDSFHKGAKNMYWIQTKVKIASDSFYTPNIDYRLAYITKQVAPFIQSYVRIQKEDADAIIQNTASPSLKFAEAKFLFTDSNFFDFFSFHLLQGNKKEILRSPNSIVISQRMAEKYFGIQPAVGKILRYNNVFNFEVSGVAQNAPTNSTINYDFIAPISSLVAMNGYKPELPDNENSFTTYYLVNQNSDAGRLETTLQRLDKEKQTANGVVIRYMAIPITETHLNSSVGDASNIKYLKVFPFIAGLILLLALINYISLSTARATQRAKEIGVRKVIGASRIVIASQFFAESAILTAFSFLLGYILCLLIQPVFFQYLQIDIDHSFLFNPYLLFSCSGLFIVSVVIAASYPSVLLSAYKPILVLYGKFNKQSGGISIRKYFTVFQFAISSMMIICAIITGRQVQYFHLLDSGVNRNNIVMVPFAEKVGRHYPAFKSDNQRITDVQEVCAARYAMYKGYDISVIKPKTGNDLITFPLLSVDENFIKMLDLKWKFPPVNSLYFRQKNATVINEAAALKFGLGPDPVNKDMNGAFTVSGVLKDFNYESPKNKIGPLVLSIAKDADTAGIWAQGGGCFYAKIEAQANWKDVLLKMKAVYEKYDSDKPFEYYFMDDNFDTMFKTEERLSRIFSLFMVFTIFIACLGLFGFSAFMAVQRSKEIGIRKVLGATVSNIVVLLSKDFVRLVIISLVIAFPVAWWAMNNWLQDFTYRISIDWWVFAFTAIAAICIALFTIFGQAIQAALANPVNSLNAE